MAQPLKVLFLEDNPQDTELVLWELRRAGFAPEWERVDTEEAFLARLRPDWDLILSDYAMPQFNGLRALDLLNERKLDVPFIIVSGSIGEDIAVGAMKRGAADYLMKDRLVRLGPAVAHALEQSRLRRENRAAVNELRTTHDQLHHLLNHSPAVIFTLKIAGEQVAPVVVSDNILRLLGFSAGEACRYEWWLGQVHPDDRERALAGVRETIERRTSSMEYRLRHKDGSTIWVEDNRRLVCDAANRPIEIVGVWTDISARKRAESSVQEASEHMLSRGRKKIVVELAVLAVFSGLVYALSARYDWFEAITTWILTYDYAQVDEIALTMLVILVGLTIIIFRQWKASEKALTGREHVHEALRLLHRELDLRVKQRTAELSDANDTLHKEVGERMQAEKELRLFRTLVDQSNDAFEIIDPDTACFLDVNERSCVDLGYTREELLSRTVKDIDPTVTDSTWSQVAQKIRQLGTLSLEGVHQRKNGTRFPVEVNVKWVRLDRDYLVAAVRDISERKQAQRLAALEHARFQFIFGSIPVGIAWMEQGNPASRIVNSAHARLTGVPVNQCQQLDQYRRATHPDDQRRQDELHQRLKAGEIDQYSLEKRYLRTDGSACWVSLSVRLFRDEDTGRNQEISTVVDLTESKQAEAALRESDERFHEIAENINEVFWITAPAKNKMLYISPGYEKIWGRSCQSLYDLPDNWLDAIHPDDRQRVLEAAATKQAAGQYDEIYRIKRPDGSLRWIRDRAYPIRNPAGKVYRVVGTAADITETRKLEEQFRQAQKMEAIGTLAGGIAHDFNNILAAMNGYAELAKLAAAGQPQLREYLDTIIKAGNRAVTLVRQILTFSRQHEQKREVIQLRSVVEESFKLLRATIPATIEFKITLAPDLLPIYADGSQIHQVLMNLGTNAWHAMRDRSGRLTVALENFTVDATMAETHTRLRAGRYVRLSISDTGCGMDRATVEHIFEPFFTTKTQGEGTGLGLAVVHGIMESHDGAITVYSEVGLGTSFHLYFPAQVGSITVGASSEEPLPLGGGKRILYVDDEEALALLGGKFLRQLGYVVDTATDPVEALALFRGQPEGFDLVVTDQAMPHMTGMDLAKFLLEIRPGLPIIVTTGHAPNLTPQIVQAAGVRALLPKPHTIQLLAMAVHRALTEKAPA